MSGDTSTEFIERLRRAGAARYHDNHPFNVRMHAGQLSRAELGERVRNRYYYQTRIPIKDALILAKSDDPAWRRVWIHRIVDHDGADGEGAAEGGLALWLKLAEAVGLDREEVRSLSAYVSFVREHSLLESVASSLTEAFAPDIMTKRIAAWEAHYPWVDKAALDYFRSRVPRARRDSEEAIAFVVARATTRELQDQCVAALIRKCEILWSLLDSVALGPTLVSTAS